MAVTISLTQFVTFSTKVSTSAKINFVRGYKYDDGYHPGKDYWKPLRDEIKKIHEQNLPIENLKNLVPTIPETKGKRANFQKAVNTYIKFVNSHNVEYFPVGKATWQLRENLIVNASPEIGLIVDGQRYFIKNYYKKKNNTNKIDSRNIQASLTLMQLALKDYNVEPIDKFAILNFQTGKLIESKPLTPDHGLELQVDAEFFLNVWDAI